MCATHVSSDLSLSLSLSLSLRRRSSFSESLDFVIAEKFEILEKMMQRSVACSQYVDDADAQNGSSERLSDAEQGFAIASNDYLW